MPAKFTDSLRIPNFGFPVSGQMIATFIVASGGVETTDGDYKIHTFLTSKINNNLDTLVESTKFEDEARDFIKFLILAWFMYCISKKT